MRLIVQLEADIYFDKCAPIFIARIPKELGRYCFHRCLCLFTFRPTGGGVPPSGQPGGGGVSPYGRLNFQLSLQTIFSARNRKRCYLPKSNLSQGAPLSGPGDTQL